MQEVRSGAVTFGHRFLTTSGRAGRAIKVKGFDDYRKRLAENFVVLERSERQDRIARELDVEARRRGGRVRDAPSGSRRCCRRCRIWSSTRRSSPARFADEFLRCPRKC